MLRIRAGSRPPNRARRPPAMTSARDGDFTTAPETGEGQGAELGAMFRQITDRSRHHNA
ncbi:hypothetical protein [Streptomyces sp. NPDC059262]|uniref:hypothetical protein n=1 Tax=Streptomyces sp. NPDC059262 TaxID=3346797 RepID=UPI0036835515